MNINNMIIKYIIIVILQIDALTSSLGLFPVTLIVLDIAATINNVN